MTTNLILLNMFTFSEQGGIEAPIELLIFYAVVIVGAIAFVLWKR